VRVSIFQVNRSAAGRNVSTRRPYHHQRKGLRTMAVTKTSVPPALDLSSLDLVDVVTAVTSANDDLEALSRAVGVTVADQRAEMRSCSGWSFDNCVGSCACDTSD
jgi:hypothetical protein